MHFEGRQDVYVSKWYAFKRMHYLLDKDEPRETIDTETECVIDDVQNSGEKDLGPFDSSPQNSNLDASEGNKRRQIDLQSENEQDVNEMSPKPKKVKAKSKNEDPRLEEAYQILKKVAAPQPVVTEDEFAVYGQHIANKLRGYSRRTRVEVEHAFSRILYDADIGKYEWVAPPVVQFVPHTMPQQLTTPLPTMYPPNSTPHSTPSRSPCLTPYTTYSSSQSHCSTPNPTLTEMVNVELAYSDSL
ncbi:unnamed protein product [Acanthoscelides obtectus]|uniref:MADF domain-containing protein n=1 Tax=Acanthoscelides obtectus TaxID=200917 RepID=A0A9P0L1K1_ACAOB|nr:unnamed protein product [Acanthoscelides obtectus]CAK1622251.1 hypothetical protein AOBTE_LOCUS1399 [Acanthoscelides obtectus]